MMRTRGAWLIVVAAMTGCVSTETSGPSMSSSGGPCQGRCGVGGPPSVPGVTGPYGEPVAMAAPYLGVPPPNEAMARAMMNNSIPLDQMNGGLAAGDPA